METKIETELNYMGVDIPVTIQKLGNKLDTVDQEIPLIWFEKNPIKDNTFNWLVNKTGCIVLSDDSNRVIRIELSDKFYDRTATNTMKCKVNSVVKTYLDITFSDVEEFKELIVIIGGDERFILPIIDYITDRYEDFERISIYVDDTNEDADYDVVESMCVVRDYVTYAWILKTKSELTHSYMQIYGNNKH